MAYGPDIVKAAVSKDSGFAKANRYQVMIIPPAGDGPPSPFVVRKLDLFAENVTLPGKQINTFDYPFDALRNMVKYPNGFMTEDVSIVFRLTNTYDIKALFDRWQSYIINKNYLLEYPSMYETTILIKQLDEKNIPIYTVKLLNAYPLTVGAIDLNSESTNTISKLSVTFTYSTLEH